MLLMQFHEVAPGATIRFVTIDSVQYLSIRDFIMVVSNKNAKNACDTWQDISHDMKYQLTPSIRKFKFSGAGQKFQDVITFPGAIKLLMWLSGENVKMIRLRVAEILMRYYAGDKCLIKEIETNAEEYVPEMSGSGLDVETDEEESKSPHIIKISFDNIAPGGIVRGTEMNGVKYVSVRDLIMVVCDKDGNVAGEVWRKLNFQNKFDLGMDIKNFQFPGSGQKIQSILSVRAAMMLLSYLPGEQAKARRSQAMEILKSHCSDTTDIPLPKKRKRTAPESYVYLLQSAAFPDYVKIGRTQNIHKRLSQLNGSMPEHPYELVTYFTSFDSVRDEAEAHQHFAKYRTVREFFKIKKEEVIPYFLKKQNHIIHAQAAEEDYYSE